MTYDPPPDRYPADDQGTDMDAEWAADVRAALMLGMGVREYRRTIKAHDLNAALRPAPRRPVDDYTLTRAKLMTAGSSVHDEEGRLERVRSAQEVGIGGGYPLRQRPSPRRRRSISGWVWTVALILIAFGLGAVSAYCLVTAGLVR